MNPKLTEKIVKTVLYEGYMLYPYRRSALKNRHRWNFGLVHPDGIQPCQMSTECLVECDADASLDIAVRFLQVESSTAECEPIERIVEIPFQVRDRSQNVLFTFPPIIGTIVVTASDV